MSNITPLSAIREIGKGAPIFTHITARGSIYIPKKLGGVEVTVLDDGGIFCIAVKQTEAPWKRYHYIGVARVAWMFTDNTAAMTDIELKYGPVTGQWLYTTALPDTE